jgi:hypothetical protein
MPRRRSFAPLLAALPLLACHGPKVEVSDRDAGLNARWHGTLASPGSLAGVVQMGGTATMGPATDGATGVAVAVRNATAGGVHPWQVHRGACGADEGVLGPAEAYRPMQVGDDGRAAASATLPLPAPTTGRYFVSVQASSANPALVVACGNLAAPTR